jgi:phosphomevalonate kinase
VISQGKVGSGFDISAACYGTHIYKRFKPYLLEPLLNMTDLDPHIIREVIDSNWDNSLKPFRIPHGLYLQLGEVKGGTNTPKMVFKLLKWRESNVAECMLMLMIGDEVWIKLQAIQDCILSKFNQLNQYYSEQPQCYEDELSFYGGPQLAQTKFSSIVDELIINFRVFCY